EIVGVHEIVEPHLQQLRPWTLNDLAVAMIDQLEAPSRVYLGDADDGLTEHGAEILLAETQSRFGASSHRHVSAQEETRDRRADHEHEQQKRGFVAISGCDRG